MNVNVEQRSDENIQNIEYRDRVVNNPIEISDFDIPKTKSNSDGLNALEILACVVSNYDSRMSKKKKLRNQSTDEFYHKQDMNGSEHRVSCHRCGNIRKRKLYCSRISCPHIFCGRCAEKMKEDYGSDVFNGGCPVCRELCCCSNKSLCCDRKNHCYRKCPATKLRTGEDRIDKDCDTPYPNLNNNNNNPISKSPSIIQQKIVDINGISDDIPNPDSKRLKSQSNNILPTTPSSDYQYRGMSSNNSNQMSNIPLTSNDISSSNTGNNNNSNTNNSMNSNSINTVNNSALLSSMFSLGYPYMIPPQLMMSIQSLSGISNGVNSNLGLSANIPMGNGNSNDLLNINPFDYCSNWLAKLAYNTSVAIDPSLINGTNSNNGNLIDSNLSNAANGIDNSVLSSSYPNGSDLTTSDSSDGTLPQASSFSSVANQNYNTNDPNMTMNHIPSQVGYDPASFNISMSPFLFPSTSYLTMDMNVPFTPMLSSLNSSNINNNLNGVLANNSISTTENGTSDPSVANTNSPRINEMNMTNSTIQNSNILPFSMYSPDFFNSAPLYASYPYQSAFQTPFYTQNPVTNVVSNQNNNNPSIAPTLATISNIIPKSNHKNKLSDNEIIQSSQKNNPKSNSTFVSQISFSSSDTTSPTSSEVITGHHNFNNMRDGTEPVQTNSVKSESIVVNDLMS